MTFYKNLLEFENRFFNKIELNKKKENKMFSRRRLNPEIENALRVLENNALTLSSKDEMFQLIKEKGKTEDRKQLVLRLEKIAKRVDKKIASWEKLRPEFRPHPATIGYESEFQSRIRSTISFLKGEFV